MSGTLATPSPGPGLMLWRSSGHPTGPTGTPKARDELLVGHLALCPTGSLCWERCCRGRRSANVDQRQASVFSFLRGTFRPHRRRVLGFGSCSDNSSCLTRDTSLPWAAPLFAHWPREVSVELGTGKSYEEEATLWRPP